MGISCDSSLIVVNVVNPVFHSGPFHRSIESIDPLKQLEFEKETGRGNPLIRRSAYAVLPGHAVASSSGPFLRGGVDRAWYTPTAHAPVCTQNLGTS